MLSLPRLIIVAASRFARGCCSTTSRNFNSPKSLHLTTRTTYNHRILLRTASSSPSSSSSQSNQSHPSQPSAILQFNLADIGEGITECELLQWFVKEGAEIAQFDKVCEVQSDKATVEITSRYDGIIKKLHYKPGDVAKVGSPLMDIFNSAAAVAAAADTTSASTKVVVSTPTVSAPTTTSAPVSPTVDSPHNLDDSHVFATPSVRRIAKENKVDLRSIAGTGKGLRITKDDILAHIGHIDYPVTHVGAQLSTKPSISPLKSLEEASIVQLSAIQKVMVKSMQQSLKIPHFGFSDEVSLLHLKSLRESINAQLKHSSEGHLKKISYMPILIKSFSIALAKYPLLNARFVDAGLNDKNGHLLYRPDHNVGVAMDTVGGLVVPNISQCNHKSIMEIAVDLNTLQQQALKGTLPPSAFKNSTITVSNIGNIGGKVLGPVIPPDTVCIVAIGKSQILPRIKQTGKGEDEWKVVKDEVLTVSFSADHRVVDGASVARFFADWKALLENPSQMILHLK